MSQPPSSIPKGLPALLLFVVALFGPPAVAAFTFTQAITQNPWRASLLFVLYEALIFLIGLLVKVWQKLEPTWIEEIAGWIDVRVRWIVSAHRRHYCQHLIYQHRDFDVKGLSTQGIHTLELEQVFVELSVEPTPAHQASSDPIQVSQFLSRGSHSIWTYLTSKPLAGQHLVVLGAPGSGKTTLLKHLALTLVTHKKRPRWAKIPRKLPILLFLREHILALKEKPDFSLVNAIQEHLHKRWQQSMPPTWIEQQLTKGRCLILLDGLDEVADPDTRCQVAEWVQQQMVAYGQNRFIITSRPYGYRQNPLSGVTILEVRPFVPRQIEQFVQNWYLANEIKSWGKDDPGVRMTARNGYHDLLRRLYSAPALLALAVNPLLLTMIATVHRYRSSLPGKRVALYGEICEVFLGKRQEARDIPSELSPAQKQQVLQPLAYSMMQEGIREIPLDQACQVIVGPLTLVSTQMQPAAFLQYVENTSGLFLERDPGTYSFAHLTFQEYLAAIHVKEEGLEQELIRSVNNTWWHETIRLYCAQADATSLIQACLEEQRPSITALTLAFECAEEALKVKPEIRTRLDGLVNQGIEDPDPERQHLAAEVILARRLHHMVQIDEERDTDTSLITNAEYQLFLDEQQAKDTPRQPDHWLHHRFPPGQGKAPLLGCRPSDASAFCIWLSRRASRTWRYRLPKAEETIDTAIQHLLSEQIANTGYWLYNASAFPRVVFFTENTTKGNQRIYIVGSPDLPTEAEWEKATPHLPSFTSKLLEAYHERSLDAATSMLKTATTELEIAGTKIRVFSPRQMGKTSLLNDWIRQLQEPADSSQPKFTWLRRPGQLLSRSFLRDLARNYVASDLAYKASADDISLLNQSLNLNPERSHDPDPIRDPNCDEALTSASTLSTTFNLDMNRLLDHLWSDTLDLDLASDLTTAKVFIQLFGQNNALTRSKKLSSPQETQHATPPDPLTFDLNLAMGFHSTLQRALKHLRTSTSTPPLKNDEHKRKFLKFLCWYIRFFALTLAIHLSTWQQRKDPSRNWREHLLSYYFSYYFGKQPRQLSFEDIRQRIIDIYLKTYAALMLLEERINGRFPAHEGILIYREKHKASQGSLTTDALELVHEHLEEYIEAWKPIR